MSESIRSDWEMSFGIYLINKIDLNILTVQNSHRTIYILWIKLMMLANYKWFNNNNINDIYANSSNEL